MIYEELDRTVNQLWLTLNFIYQDGKIHSTDWNVIDN